MLREIVGRRLWYACDAELSEVLRSQKSLDKWDRICTGHHVEKREATRHKYRTGVILAGAIDELCEDLPEPVNVFLVAWARNLSAAGVGIVTSNEIIPLGGFDDNTPVVRIDSIVTMGTHANCALLGKDQSLVWMGVEVVRVRPIHDLFVEIGMRFTGRRDIDFPTESESIAHLLKLSH